MQEFVSGDPQRVAGHQRLAAAGRNAQTDVGQLGQLRDREIPSRLSVRARRLFLERGRWTNGRLARAMQEPFERVQRELLIVAQFEHRQLTLIS